MKIKINIEISTDDDFSVNDNNFYKCTEDSYYHACETIDSVWDATLYLEEAFFNLNFCKFYLHDIFYKLFKNAMNFLESYEYKLKDKGINHFYDRATGNWQESEIEITVEC